jgi:hypothetical protein
MRNIMQSRRWMVAALAAAAAAVVLGTGGTAYAAPVSGAGVAVTPITLSSDWSGNAGYGAGAPGWYVDTSLEDPAVVHLQGAVTQASTAGQSPNMIGTLPQAARPDRSVYELVHTFNGTYADVEIDQFGNIYLIDPAPPAVQDFSFVSLEGISYERSISAQNVPIAVNTANWSGSAGFDSVAPSAWIDGSDNVHLAGAVTQTTDEGGDPLVIGTLPPAFWPNFDVYVIAHTFDGTYVDLVIEPSGQIAVIGAKYPAVNDYRFVSLEGITFSPVGGDSTPIALNTANYATTVSVFRPSADVDAWGVVHLFGAVRQVSATGAGVNTVGTVPAFARPDRYVYELIETFWGTYADVVITPAGQINLIGGRYPLTSSFGVVSLDGISYQP